MRDHVQEMLNVWGIILLHIVNAAFLLLVIGGPIALFLWIITATKP